MKTIVLFAGLSLSGFCSAAQNVGIGTTTPTARLHVTDSNVVFSASGLALASPGNTPVTGAGRRMMWYADKAAFRAGYASGTEWDNASIGRYSFATGYGATASADFTTALGLNVRSTGLSSIAIGNNAQATADYSYALGTVSFANKIGAMALGNQVFAYAPYSTAIGLNNLSKNFGGMVTGMYNDVSDSPVSDSISATDRIFQVGNGYYDVIIDDEIRSNAITVLRNGNTGIGTTTPVNRLSINGNGDITGSLGIGNSTPTVPLHFGQALGNKISLYGSNTNQYGFGIQNGLLQVYSDASAANIAFGYGSSTSFTERMRILNSGVDGLKVYGRINLLNGTSPLNTAQAGGLWLFKPDNSTALGLIGTQNNNNIGFFGGPAGWGFTYDAVNSRVGINASDPAYVLDVNGRARIRYRNGEDAGIWLNNSLNTGTSAFIGLQNNSYVGFYGTGGIGWGLAMNVNNGALAINGSTGSDKQVLTSSGTTGAPSWTPLASLLQTYVSGTTPLVQLTGTGDIDLPQATLNITVTVPSRILLYSRCNTWKACLAGACQSKWTLKVFLNGVQTKSYGVDGVRYGAENSSPGSDVTLGPEMMDVAPGIYTITFKGMNSFNDPYVNFSSTALVMPR